MFTRLTAVTGAFLLSAGMAQALTLENWYVDRAAFNADMALTGGEDFEGLPNVLLPDMNAVDMGAYDITVETRGDSVGLMSGAHPDDLAPLNFGTRYLGWGSDLDEFASGGDGLNGPRFILEFDTPISGLGFDWADDDATDGYDIYAYDMDTDIGTLVTLEGPGIGQVPWPQDGIGLQGFYGFVTDEPFVKLLIVHAWQGGSLGDMAIDNLTWGASTFAGGAGGAAAAAAQAAVPLPAAAP
ncbi:MAG: hypothetical protein VX463_09705, partial [Pseudomonadota bacterium]|nr:hypothetical protein [Pseudomonadota bacterium]